MNPIYHAYINIHGLPMDENFGPSQSLPPLSPHEGGGFWGRGWDALKGVGQTLKTALPYVADTLNSIEYSPASSIPMQADTRLSDHSPTRQLPIQHQSIQATTVPSSFLNQSLAQKGQKSLDIVRRQEDAARRRETERYNRSANANLILNSLAESRSVKPSSSLTGTSYSGQDIKGNLGSLAAGHELDRMHLGGAQTSRGFMHENSHEVERYLANAQKPVSAADQARMMHARMMEEKRLRQEQAMLEAQMNATRAQEQAANLMAWKEGQKQARQRAQTQQVIHAKIAKSQVEALSKQVFQDPKHPDQSLANRFNQQSTYMSADEAYRLIQSGRYTDVENSQISRYFQWKNVFGGIARHAPERTGQVKNVPLSTLKNAQRLAFVLDKLREKYGPITINTWVRMDSTSYHSPKSGLAVDIGAAFSDCRYGGVLFNHARTMQEFEGVGYPTKPTQNALHLDLGKRGNIPAGFQWVFVDNGDGHYPGNIERFFSNGLCSRHLHSKSSGLPGTVSRYHDIPLW